MKLNLKRFSTGGRFVARIVLCLSAIAFVWQGAFFSNSNAMAAPGASLIATADAGDRVKEKVSEDAGRAKNFIQDTKDKVERTAKTNASKVEDATDGNGGFFERKAKRDAARIEKRAEEDAARTEKAVDNTKNAVKSTVDKIKDGFSDQKAVRNANCSWLIANGIDTRRLDEVGDFGSGAIADMAKWEKVAKTIYELPRYHHSRTGQTWR